MIMTDGWGYSSGHWHTQRGGEGVQVEPFN